MPRLALLLEYDGAAFGGSQRQANAPSVQAALEEAIVRLTGHVTRTVFAGRTDSGVHACGQVAAFDTAVVLPVERWRRGLNAHLPATVAVRAVAEVAPGFDPRRHARTRTYRYRIWNAPVRSPLWRERAWFVPAPLDVPAMAQAVAALEGEHDFAAFAASPGPGRSTVRRLLRAALCQRGPLLTVEMEGTAFLPHQVRRTVGALVEIGRGRLPPAIVEQWLRVPVTGVAGPAAPPHGLCLTRVTYDTLRFDADVWDEGRE